MTSRYLTIIILLTIFGCNQPETEPEPPENPSVSLPVILGEVNEPENNPTTTAGVALGRQLFYEKQISRNNNISCATCHIQANAFADTSRFSLGSEGNRSNFNSPSLFNLAYNNHFFWDGRDVHLEIQVLSPIINIKEMDQRLGRLVEKLDSIPGYRDLFYRAFGDPEITSERVAKALSQFQRTLISDDSHYDKFIRNETNLTEEEKLGMQLFFTVPTKEKRGGACVACHVPDLFNKPDDPFANNGLNKAGSLPLGRAHVTENYEQDQGKFKIPSLRNITVTGPYMHDGRFATLMEVIDHYSDGINNSPTLHPVLARVANTRGFNFTKEEKAALMAFLKTLEDQDFLTNPAFSKL